MKIDTLHSEKFILFMTGAAGMRYVCGYTPEHTLAFTSDPDQAGQYDRRTVRRIDESTPHILEEIRCTPHTMEQLRADYRKSQSQKK